MNGDKNRKAEDELIAQITENETALDQLIKDMYQNRVNKRGIITKLFELQNPNINEQPQAKKINKKKKQTTN